MTVAGANTLGRWTHTFSDTSDFKLQAYYDYTGRSAPVFDEQRHSFDLNFQHEFALGDRNKVVWGAGYRLTTDTEVNNPTVAFNPDHNTQNLYSTFAQDEFTLVQDRLSFIFGTKLEHNDYTGFEVEPGARLLWTPAEHQTFWASVSRAVRTPSQAEETVLLTQPVQKGTLIFPVTLAGTNTFDSEKLIAYELGYRTELRDNLSIDLAAYYNHYTDLRSQQMEPGNPLQYYVGNELHGYTYGFEATATWSVFDWWRLQPAYTFLHMHLFAQPDGASPADYGSIAEIEGSSPQNQVSLRSSMDFPHGVSFDTAVRYLDNLPFYDVKSYFEMDAQISWQITKNLKVALVGQNLLHAHHAEDAPSYINTQDGKVSDIPRSLFAKITWQF
jgi:iron complex outermembrane receptor protein